MSIILGLGFLAAGWWAFVEQMSHATSDRIVTIVAVAMAVFGALLIRPDSVADRLNRMAGAVRRVWRNGKPAA